MDSLLKIVDVLPTPPGASPFHARGLFYDQVIKHAERMQGGVPAFLAELRDPRVAEFMKQRFAWKEWYDALPIVPVQAALCRIQGGDFEERVRARSRAAAEALVPRMFRLILGLGSPKTAAEHLPRLLQAHFDFGDLQLDVRDRAGAGFVKNLPRIVAPSFINTIVGLIQGSLGLMKCLDVQASYSAVSLGEPLHGFETVSCRVDFTWTK